MERPASAGCYRCLLSYFNQPDHELIDRTSDEAKQMLIDLARGRVVLPWRQPRRRKVVDGRAPSRTPGLPPPDASTVSFSGQDDDALPGAVTLSPPASLH